jgi:hypothetical protein
LSKPLICRTAAAEEPTDIGDLLVQRFPLLLAHADLNAALGAVAAARRVGRVDRVRESGRSSALCGVPVGVAAHGGALQRTRR